MNRKTPSESGLSFSVSSLVRCKDWSEHISIVQAIKAGWLTSISSTRSLTESSLSWKSSSLTISFITFKSRRESGRTLAHLV